MDLSDENKVLGLGHAVKLAWEERNGRLEHDSAIA